jgi:hypothetical protein
MRALSRFRPIAKLFAPLSLVPAALISSCGSEHPAYVDDGPRSGCGDGDVFEQRRGTACLCCHADEFSVAGSVARTGPPVARVIVTDRIGRAVDMAPNAFFNFFRHFELSPPLRPVVYAADGRELAMKQPAASGDCNACHRAGGPMPEVHGPSAIEP